MENHQLIALVLFFVGASDVVLAPIVANRQQNPQTKMILLFSMLSTAVVCVGLGLAFWMRWIG